jgi:hypothetical protein
MTIKQIAISVYLATAVLFAIYSSFWGATAYKSFMFNLGTALVWPAALFKSPGVVIGCLVIAGGLVAAVVLASRKS